VIAAGVLAVVVVLACISNWTTRRARMYERSRAADLVRVLLREPSLAYRCNLKDDTRRHILTAADKYYLTLIEDVAAHIERPLGRELDDFTDT